MKVSIEQDSGIDAADLMEGEIAVIVSSPNACVPVCAQLGDIVVRCQEYIVFPTSHTPIVKVIQITDSRYKFRRLVPGEKLIISVEKE